MVERMKPKWTTIEHYVCFDPPAGGRIRSAMDRADDGDYRWVEGDERDPCGLCYTSGTTGNPKGVLYEHRSTMLHTMAEAAPDVFNLSARAVVLPIVPMFHANAWGVPWAAPMVGCKLVLSADYRPDQDVQAVPRREGHPFSAGVPTVWLGMIEHIERTGEDLGDLKYVTIGGSAAPRAMIQWFRERGHPVGHAWGMTETSPIGTRRRAAARLGRDERRGAGRLHRPPGPGAVRGRAADRRRRRQGPAARRRQSGRLQVRGPWVVKRYFKAEEDATDDGQWFDTGDVAALHPTARCRSPTARRT